ncbi:MAG: VWA domain-containing protein [Gaiellaceae bacterium]
MTFGHPLLLLTLLAVPAAIGLFLLAERRRMRYAVTFTNLDVLASVAGGRSLRRYVAPVLFLLALASLCVSLARPHRATLVASNQATIILVIDVSGSMQATDVKPTRLQAAQAAAKKFVAEVPAGVRVGLIAFSGDPQVASVPTTDRQALSTSLDQLDFFRGFGGTAIGDALAAAVQLGKQAVPSQIGNAHTIANVTPKTLVSILFLSDGKQTRGALQPLEGAQLAKNAGIPVYTIALGTPNGRLTQGPFSNGYYGGNGGTFGQGFPVPPDPATLSAIARLTGGKFFAAETANALHSAYTDLGHRLGRVPGRKEVTSEFVALAAALLLAAGMLSALWAPRLP